MAGVGSVLIEVALLVGFLVVACWWVFGTRGVRHVTARPDYGVLSVVLRTDDAPGADEARRRLALGGIRATVAPAGAGFTATGRSWPTTAHVVLVFPSDVTAAEELLRSTPSR